MSDTTHPMPPDPGLMDFRDPGPIEVPEEWDLRERGYHVRWIAGFYVAIRYVADRAGAWRGWCWEISRRASELSGGISVANSGREIKDLLPDAATARANALTWLRTHALDVLAAVVEPVTDPYLRADVRPPGVYGSGEPYPAELRLKRRGDGGTQPWSDRASIHVISVASARALAVSLLAAADEAERAGVSDG